MKNEKNSSVIQALIDVQSAAAKRGNPEVVEMAEALLQKMNSDDVVQREADRIFDKRRYPDESLRFVKYIPTINYARFAIEYPNSAALFQILVSCAAGYTQYIRFRRTDLCKYLGWSKNKLDKALKPLVEFGIMPKYYDKDKNNGTVYCINPHVFDLSGNQSKVVTSVFDGIMRKHPPKYYDGKYSDEVNDLIPHELAITRINHKQLPVIRIMNASVDDQERR